MPKATPNRCGGAQFFEAQESGVAIPIYRTADCLLIRPNITGYVHNLIGVGWDFTRADVG